MQKKMKLQVQLIVGFGISLIPSLVALIVAILLSGGLNSTAKIVLGAGLALSVIVGTIVLIALNRMIFRAIAQLSVAVREMTKGNLHYEITSKGSNEISELAENLKASNSMVYAYVNDISDKLGRMAKGDMSVKVDLEYAGDFAPIKAALQQIAGSLSQVLSQINQSAELVSNGSQQVASGALALSQGANEQANAIDALSETINDISDQIRANAQNAQQTGRMLDETVQGILSGNEQMSRLVAAMGEISGSSDQIGKIIKTIDDIAFQTNILALNAAVEAARAGAAGKGFAVVADEVRNLAGKSAQAAKDTTALIAQSIEAVENGTLIADETARSLNAIVEKSEHVSKLVNEIARACNEQANSVGHITAGVDRIAGVVQTNSQTAEHSAASSEELSSQAQLLKQLVSRFKLGRIEAGELEYEQVEAVAAQSQNTSKY